MEEFIVDTNDHCFICLKRIPTKSSPLKTEDDTTSLPKSFHSIQHLSRYMKMNLKRVFNEEGSVPSALLAKVQKANLQVELCERCASLNQNFSGLYKKLEKIEMEVASCTRLIHSIILEADETDIKKLANTGRDSGSEINGKLEIAKILRAETTQKCSAIIQSTPLRPTVRIQKLTKSDHLKLISRPQQLTKLQNVKVESQDVVIYGGSDNDNDSWCSDNADLNLGNMVKMNDMALPVSGKTDKAKAKTKRQHLKISLGRNSKTGRHICRICKLEFGKSSISYHFRRVHLKQKWECICGKQFANRPHYNRHYQTLHMGIKHMCGTCNKVFNYKDHLVLHRRTTSCRAENSSML